MRKFLFIPLLFIFSNCKTPQQVDYYLPNSYQGEVAIIFSDKGDSAKFKNDRQQIIIPKSGFVVINQKPYFGQVDYKYYIGTSTGFSEISRHFPGMATNKGQKYVFFEESENGTLIGKKGNYLHYNAFKFYIGQKLDSSVDRERFHFSRYIDSIIIEQN